MPRPAISAGSLIEDVLARFPATARAFVALGLPCFVCGEPAWCSVGELCRRRGKDPARVLAELNLAAAEGETRGRGRASE